MSHHSVRVLPLHSLCVCTLREGQLLHREPNHIPGVIASQNTLYVYTGVNSARAPLTASLTLCFRFIAKSKHCCLQVSRQFLHIGLSSIRLPCVAEPALRWRPLSHWRHVVQDPDIWYSRYVRDLARWRDVPASQVCWCVYTVLDD